MTRADLDSGGAAQVALAAALDTPATRALFAALRELLPVTLADAVDDASQFVARIETGCAATTPLGAPGALNRLCVPALPQAPDAGGPATDVDFSDDADVPWPFRGRTIACRLPRPPVPVLDVSPGEQVLASSADGALWTVRRQEGHARLFRSVFALPQLSAATGLSGLFESENLIRLLPLLDLLRRAAAGRLYDNPPLRASFVVDDPNLHWPRYGFADFSAIAARAAREHYHVGFATIPLDAWFVHRGCAEIFRAHAPQLSLVVHGNNHERDELAQRMSPADCAALLCQANARIAVLEAKAHLTVCRVMIPPHGACSAQVLGRLPAHGFESACISKGSLQAHNAGQAWTRALGIAPSEMVDGCPVLPRWALTGMTDGQLRWAAYLGQPLILRGHHQDLRDGLERLDSLARTINAIGPVRWGDLTALSRLNYQTRIDASVLRVRPLGTKLVIRVPEGAAEVAIETGAHVWRTSSAARARRAADGTSIVLPVPDSREITIERAAHPPPTIGARPRPTRFRHVLRRALTEARDRLRLS
jgi:hypothetical protein